MNDELTTSLPERELPVLAKPRAITLRGLRRAMAVILSPLLLLLLLAASGRTSPGYVSYSPGPLLKATALIDGLKTPYSNNYHFTTIIASAVTYADIIRLHLNPKPNVTLLHINLDPAALATNATEMVQSRMDAAAVATAVLGAPYYIQAIAPHSLASTYNLAVGDELTAVNAVPALLPTAIPSTTHPGQRLQLTLIRGSSKKFVVNLTQSASSLPTVIGLTLSPLNKVTAKVSLQVFGVSGPSGGLAMTLQAIDALLSKNPSQQLDALNKDVIATGTISANGSVGPVGGVDQKVRSAKGAAVFLIPAGELSQAKKNAPANLKIVGVTSIDQAISWLCQNTATVSNKLCLTLTTLSAS